ncbi:hypothetical protein [Kordia sp.]
MKTQILTSFAISKRKALQITGGEEDKPVLKEKFKKADSKVQSPVNF